MPNLPRRDFRGYLLASEDELLSRYLEVCNELFHLEQELALSLASEQEAKLITYFGDDFTATTHQAREMWAKRQALSATMASHELKGDIAAFNVEKRAIELVLERKHPHVR